MNLHQFRFVQEAVRQKLNLTETAKVLFTSQPGISKAILELEEELGVDIFVRHGKRLVDISAPGKQGANLPALDVPDDLSDALDSLTQGATRVTSTNYEFERITGSASVSGRS